MPDASWPIALLWLLAFPYIGLLVLVLVGMVARPSPRPTRPARWPSVSVVVPARDEEASLPATLEALAAQRYAGPVEFVIVDDRSRDRTPERVNAWAARDPRFRLHRVTQASKRLAPKVHAVAQGIAASSGEIIVTTDADCVFGPDWIETLVGYFEPDVAMVTGWVHCTTRAAPGGPVQRFDAIDWMTLMFTSRSLARFGWSLSSSANNQAYRRSAFDAVGGFGAAGRAPSGDEDLLVQRIGRLPGSRVVFADHPAAHVQTQPAASLGGLLRQRRRWVSRYHHSVHYQPWFMAGIVVLGAHSVALAGAWLATPFAPHLAPWVAATWALVGLVQVSGLAIGTREFGRRDLWPVAVVGWALFHPFFVATVSLWSLASPGAWGSGSPGYRRRLLRRRVREASRRIRMAIGGA